MTKMRKVIAMENREKKRNRRKGVLCWLLTVVMLLTGLNVNAAVFEASQNSPDFSDGESFDAVIPEEETGEMIQEPETQDAVFAQEESGFGEMQNRALEEVPDIQPIETEDSALFLGEGQSPEEETPAEAEEIKLVFADSKGNIYQNLTAAVHMGDTVTLPVVPGFEDVKGSGWKLDLSAADSDVVVLSGGSAFCLDSKEEYVTEKIKDGTLTFYAVTGMLTVNFYSNGGATLLKSMQVKPGTTIKLPDVPDSRYVNFGWTDILRGTAVKYKIGAACTVSANTSFYIVRYAAAKVKTITFLGPTGASGSQYKALTLKVVVNGNSGTTVKLPSVPAAAGYSNLGWSLQKNAKSASYAPGKTIKVTKNMTFYAVRKKLASYSVAFNNNSGTSKSKVYTALNKKVYAGEYITLPEVPKASGYVNLGWTTTKKGTRASYKAGSRIKVTKNLKFYAVRKKAVYYTVAFYTGTGASGSIYKALSKRVLSGTTITLPSVPDRSGYVNLGWSTSKNAASAKYKAGAKIKITKNLKLYAVQKRQAKVVLRQKSGAVWKTCVIAEGSSLTLPGAKNKPGYTMMGWSRTSGQSVNPDYQVGAVLKNIKGTINLYAVVFNRSSEPDYSAAILPQANLRAYKQVIFVGDSRTNRMANTLERQGDASLTNGISFIYEEGQGLSWFKEKGYKALLKQVGNGTNSILEKKTIVIFNLGVNDLGSINDYILYMRSIAPALQKKGCELYYMSVNPINNEMIKALGKNKARKESDVCRFNAAIRSNLCSGSGKLFTYIDCYNYLMKTGYGTDRNRDGEDEGIDDGLHYTTKTYKRIYRYCMNSLPLR